MGIKKFFSNMMRASDEETSQFGYEDTVLNTGHEEYELAPHHSVQKVKPRLKGERQMATIKIVEPRIYGEVEGLASLLLDHKAIIVNFRRMEKSQASRVIDYLAGIIFALHGTVQKLNDEIFLFASENFEIDGVIDGDDVANSHLDFIDSL